MLINNDVKTKTNYITKISTYGLCCLETFEKTISRVIVRSGAT